MNQADDRLRAGDLDGARAALIEVVRREPGNVPNRMFLFQLLALTGEWDKAKAQLGSLAQMSPEAQMLSVVYGQAIDAERQREAVFAGTLRAEIHSTPAEGEAEWATPLAEAIQAEAQGRAEDAERLRQGAFDAAPDTPGHFDDAPFDWIADADPRFGPTLEAIIGGRYGLLPFDRVTEIVSEGPRDLRDIIWYPVEITLKSGPRIAALIPTRYPGASTDAAERLARATGWDAEGRGSGQRVLVTSDDQDHGLLTLRSLRFG
ncbi:impE family protein [Sphingomonas sp. S17]|uniref:Tetratricopeptide repeat protein n=2 Tax=Sphingomonas paucimobilis TaxID=13689 RepID=A0A7T3A749_SPHPI|nr:MULTISPECIES: type VI secretion system accessory protein TagJ [Sphingomonas]EGI55447.1 impE family protein [Sphingomonas sp. S17]MDG5971315.1 tetratricopeptide repeat protein [Sphingomonas paucimobilis]QPS15890.1 tetratricopeptide repeat protein [Sphingomonas paucimobilis]QPT07343.1 tetratricopeptide repeat protein [Sphingomonas paucimobilis]SUJ09969.1 Protein of avirulence locus involved in temperature-dependent protein secretion [Sphingomonas paucimobilis]